MILTYDVDKNIELVKQGKLTKEEVIKAYEDDKKIYSDCKDGSAQMTAFNCMKIKEALKDL